MMTKLKVGLVLDDTLDSPDGVQQYVLAVGNWLGSQGHDVHYIVGQTTRTDVDGQIHSLAKNLAVRFNGNRLSIPLPTSRKVIRKLLAEEQFDVLHVQIPHSPALAHRIINEAGPETAIIGTFHILPYGIAARAGSRVLAGWTRSSLKKFDHIFAVSTAAQAFAKKTFKLNTTVLPNVFDYQRFAKAKPFEHYKDKLTVIFVGRLVPRKGCMMLLHALNELTKDMSRLPSFRVIICGKGPLEAKLKAYAEEHHLLSLVEFAGFVTEEDKPGYLQSADIAVYPSSGGESFGIVLIEAMAAGNAVLAGDNKGYHSVMYVRPELLFPPRDSQILADKLAHLLSDDKARKDAQQWAKEYSKQFDTDTVGHELVKMYEQALHAKRNVR